jgi:drug/metabolite transporter (DMT)-like permease
MPLNATLLALFTVVLWSFLAFLGARVTHIPPFLVLGVALCVSGLVSALRWREWRIPPRTLLVGIAGIFGYHFLYFSALQRAPVIEASLMNYLWPLLIVLLSPLFLSGYRLRTHHLVGALMGLSGAGLIITGGRVNLDMGNLPGYLLAAGAALTWSSYSLMTKRLPAFPTAAVGAFCLSSGLFSLGAYYISGSGFPISSLTGADWFSLILLGVGPLGTAFFTWDASLKRGDPRIIGSLAYLTPLTSTVVLVALGGQSLTWVSALAMLLIVGGAIIGSLDLFCSQES